MAELNLVGQTLGAYRILEEIGRGGMATVYKACEPALDRYVAVKVLPHALAHDPEFVARFEREAKAIARLDHPNILPVYSYGQEGGLAYIAMRYVKAGTLKEMLGQPLDLQLAFDILRQVGAALNHAHQQGIVHRDVKPSNVLMADRQWALLTDFGIARLMESSTRITKSGVGVGTPAYMSPEQGQGLSADARSDVYSLGVMLYEMVTGQVPYDAETPMAVLLKHMSAPLPLPRNLRLDLPEAVENVILKAMAKNPNDRYQTAIEMVQAMEQAMAEPTAKPQQQETQRMSLFIRHKEVWVIVALASILAVVGLVAFWPRGITLLPLTLSPGPLATQDLSTLAVTSPPLSKTPGETRSTAIEPLLTISTGDKTTRAVAFSPDGSKLASGGDSNIIHVWDTSSGQKLLSMEGHTNIVTSLAWSPDGKKLASGSDDKTVRIWDAATGAPVLPPLEGHAYFVLSVAWSPDGKWLASASYPQVMVWDASSGAVVSKADLGTTVMGVDWSPDGTRLAASLVGEVQVIDPDSGQKLERMICEGGDSLGVGWSPDGTRLAAAGHDNNVHVWQVDHWDSVQLLRGHASTVTAVTWSPDSKWLASTAYDTTLRVWNVDAQAEALPALALPETAFGVDWSRDGRRLATAGGRGLILIWDAGSLAERQ